VCVLTDRTRERTVVSIWRLVRMEPSRSFDATSSAEAATYPLSSKGLDTCRIPLDRPLWPHRVWLNLECADDLPKPVRTGAAFPSRVESASVKE
jgi:hypothetical protein